MEVAASVVGLLTAGAQITLILQSFIECAINAPALARRIHHEVHEFEIILSKLQPIVLGPLDRSRASLIDIHHLSFTLAGCVCTFSELEKQVSELKCTGKMDFTDRIRWSRAESTFKPLIERLQSHKASLTLILTILTCQSNLEAISYQQSLDNQLTAHTSTSKVSSPTAAGIVQPPPSVVIPDPSILPSGTGPANAQSGSWVASISHFAFQATLFNTRLYQRVLDKSGISPSSVDRPAGRWSLVSGGSNTAVFSLPVSTHKISGTSLADVPEIAVLPLPISGDFMFGSPRYHSKQINDGFKPGVLRSDKVTKAIDIPMAQSRLSSGPATSPDTSDFPVLDTRLHRAVNSRDETSVQMLLRDQRDNINGMDLFGDTALHLAVLCSDSTAAKRLLTLGADVNARGKNNETELHHAVRGGNLVMSKVLVEGGADVNATSADGNTPMHLAAGHRYHCIVQLLLDGGNVNLEAKNLWGMTPLHVAALAGGELVVQLLLDHGAEIEARDQNGNTPLLWAAQSSYKPAIQLLLERGANKEAKDRCGDKTIDIPRFFGDRKAVELLIESGLNTDDQVMGSMAGK